MVDFKIRLGVSLLVAMAIAMIIYAFLNPVVVWYLTFVPGMLTNTHGNVFYSIVASFISYGLPIIALFLCVASVFEAFLK